MILKSSEINASKITHPRDTIRSASYFIIKGLVFDKQQRLVSSVRIKFTRLLARRLITQVSSLHETALNGVMSCQTATRVDFIKLATVLNLFKRQKCNVLREGFLKLLTPCKYRVELRHVPYLFIKLVNISVLCKKGIESVMFFWGGLLNDFKTKRDKCEYNNPCAKRSIRSASYFVITVFEDQFSRLLKFALYLHRYVAHLKHSYF